MSKLRYIQTFIYTSIILIFVQTMFVYNYFSATCVSSKTTSALRITVCDISNNPLSKAKICIVEINKFFYTDDKGLSPIITIPITPPLSGVIETDWFSVTVLVYCDGFIDTALYNCIVYKDRIRNGPIIRLLAKDENSPSFITMVENPSDLFTSELFDKFR